jgi:sugar lactone lactonase YvrE
VVADRDGRIYVTSVGRDNLVLFVDGKVVVERTDLGLRRPHDIDIDAQGRIHLVDPGHDRVVVLDRELKPVRVLTGAPYRFKEPKYIAFDEQGRLYVADEHNHQVKIYDSDYRPLWVIGTGKAGDAPGQLRKPEGVAARGGRLWIADTYNNRILLYSLP